MEDLVSPGHKGNTRASISGPVAKRSEPTPVRVGQELEIVESTAAPGKACEGCRPARLLLEAVLEVDVGVGERDVVLGEFLQAENYVFLGGLLPRAGVDQLGARSGKLLILINAVGGSFDTDNVAGVKEGLGRGGRN